MMWFKNLCKEDPVTIQIILQPLVPKFMYITNVTPNYEPTMAIQ